MARRRYLSTDVSVDPSVADLATQYGDFAALLYTWLIPHAADDASVPSDPRKLLMAVVPGLGKTAADVQHAIDGMLSLGLLVQDDQGLRFPPSFFKHQSYIKGERRGSPQLPTPPDEGEKPSGDQRESAHNSADQRSSAQIIASSSFSSSFNSPTERGAQAPAPPVAVVAERVSIPKPKKQYHPLTDEDRAKLVAHYARAHPDGFGSAAVVEEMIEEALSHEARRKHSSEYLYVRNWLRTDLTKYQRRPANVVPMRPQPVVQELAV